MSSSNAQPTSLFQHFNHARLLISYIDCYFLFLFLFLNFLRHIRHFCYFTRNRHANRKRFWYFCFVFFFLEMIRCRLATSVVSGFWLLSLIIGGDFSSFFVDSTWLWMMKKKLNLLQMKWDKFAVEAININHSTVWRPCLWADADCDSLQLAQNKTLKRPWDSFTANCTKKSFHFLNSHSARTKKSENFLFWPALSLLFPKKKCCMKTAANVETSKSSQVTLTCMN